MCPITYLLQRVQIHFDLNWYWKPTKKLYNHGDLRSSVDLLTKPFIAKCAKSDWNSRCLWFLPCLSFFLFWVVVCREGKQNFCSFTQSPWNVTENFDFIFLKLKSGWSSKVRFPGKDGRYIWITSLSLQLYRDGQGDCLP